MSIDNVMGHVPRNKERTACPDYDVQQRRCKIYGGDCKWLPTDGSEPKGIHVDWVGSCMRTQAYNRGNVKELLREVGSA